MAKRTTVTVPPDLEKACTRWIEEEWALRRHKASLVDALLALARLGAESSGLIEAPETNTK